MNALAGGLPKRNGWTIASQPPRAETGVIPLTATEIAPLLITLRRQPATPDHTMSWLTWMRRHQALARWYHQRTQLARDTEISLVSKLMAAALPGPELPSLTADHHLIGHATDTPL